jgi:phosphoglycolate phosphatase-like HAD superfamily hydrolase
MNRRRVLLFDIDGTLLLSDGAGSQALSDVLQAKLGIRDHLGGIAFAGRTDPLILADILARHEVMLRGVDIDEFWEATYVRAAELLAPGRGRVLPGVVSLLERIAEEPGWTTALLTGNNAPMAKIKLRHYGLEQFFTFGAFGDQAADRNALARVAVARSAEYGAASGADCIVIGDTPLDIACARAAGAWAVAVATGSFSGAELAPHEPDLLLGDLVDPEPLIAFVRDLPAGERSGSV